MSPSPFWSQAEEEEEKNACGRIMGGTRSLEGDKRKACISGLLNFILVVWSSHLAT